ncbi:MAG: RnfABCDGE type electron transport complex subunit D [Kiritimatiellae bacterium]|nr:RnfABCDGE type electron transport complex subunit D [Kiritimatiellia bacterium]
MKVENQTELFLVSSSPHTHIGSSVERIMLDVLIALAPAFAASLYFFGVDALRLTATCVATCLLAEWLCRKAMGRTNTISDLSAIVTGVLLAFNLPPSLPTWMAAAGSLFAITICKQIFGGIGYNVFNPALAARAFMLISFTGAMTVWSNSGWIASVGASTVDATTVATPLGVVKEALKAGAAMPNFTGAAVMQLFTGKINGCIGETSALALLLGAAYLLWRKVITWHIPGAYIGTVFIYASILHLVAPEASVPPQIHLLSGGLILGACFMATDMVTSPVTRKGMLIFGVGCGIITMLIRTVKSGAYPEGVSFAILLMNAITPLINRGCRNKVFGTKS